MSIKVLHVAEVLKGGTSSYMQELLNYQVEHLDSSDIFVVGPKSQISHLTNLSSLNSFPYNDFPSRLKNIFELGRHVKKILNKHAIDLIHIHGTFAGVAVRLALAFAIKKPKIIYCSHGWAFDRESAPWKNALIGYVEFLLSFLCNRIICISQHDYESARRRYIPDQKLITIKNGIADVPQYELNEVAVIWPEKRFRFLFAGRFDKQKGVDLFFAAMQQLGEQAFAYVIGAQSLGDDVVFEPPSNVQLTGWLSRDQVSDYMKSCDVFVMPSRWEGFGLSALEAMRASKPVIATQVGGLPELIENGVNGFLIEKNNIEQLTAAMKKIAQLDHDAMGNAGRLKYERLFTSDILNRSILDLYNKVLLE